jgi:hypothetical protein
MENIKKTTPNSAKYLTVAESVAKAKAFGPINTPIAK